MGEGERLTASGWAGSGMGEGLEETWGALHTLRVPLLKASQVSSLPSWRETAETLWWVLCRRDHALPPAHRPGKAPSAAGHPAPWPLPRSMHEDVLAAVLVSKSHLRSRAHQPQRGGTVLQRLRKNHAFLVPRLQRCSRSTYCIPGRVLGAGDGAVLNWTRSLACGTQPLGR